MKRTLLFIFTMLFVVNIKAQNYFTSYNSGTNFSTITVDGLSSRVWAGTSQNGVYKFEIASSSNFSLFNVASSGPALNDIRIKSMAADKNGNVWIAHEGINFSGGQGGLERINTQLNRKHFGAETNYISVLPYNREDGLATRRLTSICIDKNNKVWTAHKYTDLTSGSTYLVQPGAFSYKLPNELKFSTYGGWRQSDGSVTNPHPTELPYPAYTYNPPISQTPQSRTMDAIACDDTFMYIAVRGYLKRGTNNQTDAGYVEPRLLSYLIDDTSNYLNFSFSDMGFTPGGVINAICANDTKGVWVTTSLPGKGFSVRHIGVWNNINSSSVDSDNVPFSNLIPENTKFNTNAIWKDRTGRVFMGTDKGLIVYNGKGDPTKVNSYKRYTNDIQESTTNPLLIIDPSMTSNMINGGCADPNNVTESWIATDNGIMKLTLQIEDISLYHIKDHYSYNSLTVDTPDKITFLTSLDNKSTQQGPVEPAEENEIPRFAADGSSSTIIRIPTDNPEGFYETGNESYKIFVGPGPYNQTFEPEYIKRYGYFYLKSLSSYPDNPTSADQLEYVEFEYKHPEYIHEEDYFGNLYTQLDLQIFDITDSANPLEIFKHPIKIAVPPVLIGHGVWSGIDSVEDIKEYLLDAGFKDYMLSLVWRPKMDDDDKAPEHPFDQDAWVIPTYIKALKNNSALAMFSAGKVNVIAHSRGGLYTRAYVEGINNQYSNSYRDDINSLITLDTPHFGAQGANLVLDKRIIFTRESIEDAWDENISSIIPIEWFFDVQDISLGDIVTTVSVPLQDRDQNWGARNLVVEIDNISGIGPSDNVGFIPTLNNSINLAKLVDHELPIHTISSEFDVCLNHPMLCGDFSQSSGIKSSIFKKLFLVMKMATNNYFPNGLSSVTEKIYNGETNDFVVPLISMQGGLGGTPYNTNFDPSNNIDHSGALGISVTKAPIVHDKILSLIKSNIHDSENSLFTKQGLNHSKRTYTFLNDVLDSANTQRNNNQFTSKILINRDPSIFDNVTEGDILTFNVYQEDVDEIMITYESKSNPDNFEYEMRSQNLNFENQFTYTIPEGFNGELTITAYGFKEGFFALAKSVASLNVNIPNTITLQNISFEQENPIILNQDNYSHNIIGSFSDGIDRIINSFDGLTYSIEDTSIVSQIDINSVKGEAAGTTLLTATINGLEDTIMITVKEDPSLTQTILTGFYGIPDIDNNTINVHWETLREYENATFVLETSYNTPDNFSEINQQPGNGTLNTPALFSFNDSNFSSNTLIYYRLKIINTSGEFIYSPIIEIDLSTLSINENNMIDFGLKLFPNPVKAGNISLKINSNFSDTNTKLELYTLQGKRLSLQTLDIIQGNNSFNIKLSKKLNNGIYIVRISTSKYVKSIKLVVNK